MSNYQFIGRATPSVQKQINTSLVYHYICEHSLCHRAAIAKELNLSAPAVSRAVDVLLERKDILETDKYQLENGKKVTQLKFNAKKEYVIGIDLLRNPMKMVISDFSGEIVKRWEGFELNREEDIIDDLIAESHTLINTFCEEQKVDKKHIAAIGIGVPATIDSETGVVLGTQRYDYLLGKNYGKRMEEEFHLPTFVDNITNMSAIAERKRGVSKGKQNFVFLEVSTGIGLGIIINGLHYPGSFGAAGEIGYTPLTLEHLQEKYAPLGYLERTISMQSIAEKAKEMGLCKECDSVLSSVANVFYLAKEGNSAAKEIFVNLFNHILVLCSNVILMLNPDQVVLGGSIAAMPYVEDLIVKELKIRLGGIIPFEVPEIILSSLGDDSGVIGAVEMALYRLKSAIYPYRFEG
jgi:glucokinase